MSTCSSQRCEREATDLVTFTDFDRRAGVTFKLCHLCSNLMQALGISSADILGIVEFRPIGAPSHTTEAIAERVEHIAEKAKEVVGEECIHEQPKNTCSICKNGGRLGVVQACGGCGDGIVWVVTSNGRNMPVDPDPITGGNVVYTGTINRRPTVRVLHKDEEYAGARYVAHFTTCTNPPPRNR